MKIVKYIFLLFLLLFIALTVFVATLNPEYKIVKSKVIKISRNVAFNYVNDFKNWEEFGSWKEENPNIKYKLSKNTTGNGSLIAFNSESIKTINSKVNESINQEFKNSNGDISKLYWDFKDTLGKTKITCKTIGRMSFMNKVSNAFQGGVDSKIGYIYEKNLSNIEQILDLQINTYAIKIEGFVNKQFGFYIQKTINSKTSNVSSNIQIMIPNLMKFIKKNKIQVVGKPFVKYNSVNSTLKTTNFSVCIALKEELFTDPESEYVAGNLESFQAIKSTLTGDYSHFAEAKEKNLEQMTKLNLIQKSELPSIEVYTHYKGETKNPTKWITEFYVPVKLKVAPKKIVKINVIKTETVPEKVDEEINIQ
jgi:predicted transcriptional regulator YdeE